MTLAAEVMLLMSPKIPVHQNGSTMEHSHMTCKKVPISFLHLQHELLFISPILESLQGVQ